MSTARVRMPTLTGHDLPPGFDLVALREHGDALAHALRLAPERGAGTLVHVGHYDLFECAVVLQPTEPLAQARRAIYAVMTALAQSLAALVPPEVPLAIEWPATLRLASRLVGGGVLAWPQTTPEDGEPDWLVAGIMVRQATPIGAPADRSAAGRGISLEAVGVPVGETDGLLGRFARCLLAAADGLEHEGFAALAQRYLALVPPDAGIVPAITSDGDLVLRRSGSPGAPVRCALREGLAACTWRDPASGEPWL